MEVTKVKKRYLTWAPTNKHNGRTDKRTQRTCPCVRLSVKWRYVRTFEYQISSVSRSCFYHIRDLRRIRSVVNFNTAKTTGTSCVHSRLDFCNSLYYGLPKTQLNRLHHIQDSLARAVVAAPRSSDADLILKYLDWLRVPEHIEYKIASTTYKLLQHSCPQYLRNLITIQPSRSTRSSSVVTLLHPQLQSILKVTNRSSATQHPISGTDFLRHSDYNVHPLHPPVVLHSLDLLLACLIWCSILVSKLTFSLGPFLRGFFH